MVVGFPEGLRIYERVLGHKALGSGGKLEDSAIHHSADIGGSFVDVSHYFHELDAAVLVFGESFGGSGAS